MKYFLRYQKASMDPKVFIFVNKFDVCLFFMDLRAQKQTMGTFLTLGNKKHCGFLHFNLKFTKFKTFYQKMAMIRLKFLKKKQFFDF